MLALQVQAAMESAASAANSRSTSHAPSRAQSPDYLPDMESSHIASASLQSNSTSGLDHTTKSNAVYDTAHFSQPASSGVDAADVSQDAAQMDILKPSSSFYDVHQSMQQSNADVLPDQRLHAHTTDGSVEAADSVRHSLQNNSAVSMHSNAGVSISGQSAAAGPKQPLHSESQAFSSVTGSKDVSPDKRHASEATSQLSASPAASLASREAPSSADKKARTSVHPQPLTQQPDADQLHVNQAALSAMPAKDLAPEAELQAAHLNAPASSIMQELVADTSPPTKHFLPVQEKLPPSSAESVGVSVFKSETPHQSHYASHAHESVESASEADGVSGKLPGVDTLLPDEQSAASADQLSLLQFNMAGAQLRASLESQASSASPAVIPMTQQHQPCLLHASTRTSPIAEPQPESVLSSSGASSANISAYSQDQQDCSASDGSADVESIVDQQHCSRRSSPASGNTQQGDQTESQQSRHTVQAGSSQSMRSLHDKDGGQLNFRSADSAPQSKVLIWLLHGRVT